MSLKKYILSIDQGTTGTTVMILDRGLTVLAKVNNEFPQIYPQPGWVEHDADLIWQGVVRTLEQAIAAAEISADDIAAIGITNQRETTVLWDKVSGVPVHNAIVWQDRRTADICERLKKRGLEKKIKAKTGLVLDPYFSATKLQWLLKNSREVKACLAWERLNFGTVDSFLTFKLTGHAVHVTDVSNASRTLLMNLKTLAWDDELLKIFQVPRTVLPQIRSCSEIYGKTRGVPGLPDGIPVAGMAGDQQAALFGQACFDVGEAKCTYGTGSFLLMNTGAKPIFSRRGLITTVAWKIGKAVSYALEGSVFIAGAAVQWLRDGLKIIDKAHEIEELARTVADNGGVYFVPALAGLGAPHWDPHARGLICGLTRGSQRGHIARATLEGIAFSQNDILACMQKEAKKPLKRLKVDGGAAANDLLMQFQADVLGCEIIRPQIVETTAMGAAFLAGLAVGLWTAQQEIVEKLKVERVFEPDMSRKERAERIQAWRVALRRVRA